VLACSMCLTLPLILKGTFHQRLLDAVEQKIGKGSRLNMGFIFEDTPFYIDREVLERYLSLFDERRSVLRLYLSDPDSSTAARNAFPTNMEDVRTLVRTLSRRVRILVAALLGLPGQSRNSTVQMRRILGEMRDLGAETTVYTAELHPGSAIWSDPESFGVDRNLKSFESYYEQLRNRRDKRMMYGYATNNDVDLEEQLRIIALESRS
jgi:hypothetical protein